MTAPESRMMDIRYTYIPKGAVILTKGRSRLSRLILWAQRSWGEKESCVNHGLTAAEGALLKDLICIESVSRHVERPFRIHHIGDIVTVYDYIGISPKQRDLIVEKMRSYLGDWYGWWKLIPQFIDNKLLFGKRVTRRLIFPWHFPYCTLSLGEGLEWAGIHFGRMDGKELSPDEIDDYCLAHPEEWRCIIYRGLVT